MVGQKAAFGYGHPFFDEACQLRQRQWNIYDIVQQAHERGYTDLTWNQIAYGLRRAPADLFLPTRTTRWLRQRYEQLDASFNSYTTQRDLIQEALEKIHDIQEELDNPELPTARRMWLEQQLNRWYDRAFDWSDRTSQIALKLEDARNGGRPPADTPVARVEDVSEHEERLVNEFLGQLPPAIVQAEFGEQHIRVPTDAEEVELAPDEEAE